MVGIDWFKPLRTVYAKAKGPSNRTVFHVAQPHLFLPITPDSLRSDTMQTMLGAIHCSVAGDSFSGTFFQSGELLFEQVAIWDKMAFKYTI